MYTEARAIKSSIIQFVCVHWQIDCALMSLWEYLAQCECVEPSHMIYSITVRDKQFIRGDFGGFANTCWSNFIDWNPFVKSKLRTAPHLPSSTLLLFTVSVSVANTYRRGNLTPPPPRSVFMSQCAPCFPPLAATEQLCWPSGCGGKGCCCCCCQMPRRFRVLLIKPFLWATESRSGESDGAEEKLNLWPQLSPVQQQTLSPVITRSCLHPETPHDTASALQWSLCMQFREGQASVFLVIVDTVSIVHVQ